MTPLTPRFHALTLKSVGSLASIVTCEVRVATPSATPAGAARQTLPFKAIWDTGATASVITPKVASDLSLAATGVVEVRTANGRRDSNVYLVDIELPNGVRVANVRVTDGDLYDCDVLIGMDIVTMGDLSITNTKGVTTMSFRIPSLHEIDYVEEANRMNLLGSTTRRERRDATLADRKAHKKGSRK